MSADPAQRPASAGELVRRLETAFEPERPTREVAPAATRSGSSPPTPRRRPIIVPALLVLAALAVAGVLVAALGSGGTKSSASSASTPRTSAHRPAATTGARSATSTTGTTAPPTSAGAASTSSTPSTPSAAPSGAPAAAVEQFYAAAARHDYATAWALAGPNLRSQLGGYAAFQHLFSSVRSITFQSAQVSGATSSNTATVALRTTSVQTDRTQQCTGTAGTVRSDGRWLVDHVAISCA
jgi:hypothetical protein